MSKSKYGGRYLLITGTTALLEGGHISLTPKLDEKEQGHIFTTLYGFPAVVMWRMISFDEIEVLVWWKCDHVQRRPPHAEQFYTDLPGVSRAMRKKTLGAAVMGWLERRTGKYM